MEGMTKVFFEKCPSYSPEVIGGFFDKVSEPLGIKGKLSGSKVLLKPNLISGKGAGLACTNPQFIVSLATWCLDHGADVSLGDSPAFGSASRVLRKLGVYDTLQKLGVSLVEFSKKEETMLDCGVHVGIAPEVNECDLFINAPKIKAHSQMYVTMAMKNVFGIISGIRKPLLHMQYGDDHCQFAPIIVDLLKHLPDNITMVDGVEVMHESGPVNGESLLLHCLAAGRDPVAVDMGIMTLLGLDPRKNPLLEEAIKRDLPGARMDALSFPFEHPDVFADIDFKAPESLSPIRFNPLRFVAGQAKRFALKLAP